jgi:hypothetical protein
MLVAILAAILLMAAYFLVLYGGVGFIQDKRFFSSASKEILDAIPDKKERFRGAHIIGWIIEGDRGPAVSGRSRSCRVGRDPKRLWIFPLLWPVSYHALLHGALRYSLFQLVPALPFKLLPAFLSRAEGHRRAAYVRL